MSRIRKVASTHTRSIYIGLELQHLPWAELPALLKQGQARCLVELPYPIDTLIVKQSWHLLGYERLSNIQRTIAMRTTSQKSLTKRV